MIDIIVVILLSAFILMMITPFIKINRSSKRLLNDFNYTIYYFKNELGFIISLNGDIGMGKTSLMSGLSSVGQLAIIQDIYELIEKTKKILYLFSFNDIDSLLDEYYQQFTFETKDDYPDFDYITELIINGLNVDPNSFNFNFIANTSNKDLILDYVQAYFVINYRNNFVQSKTPFFSHITGNFNLELDLNWLEIRKAYENEDYAILDWALILLDESTDELSAAEWQSDVKDEKGAKEYRRKFRQIHQGRNRIISAKQDMLDEVKRYRNLTHSHLQIDQKVSTTGNYLFIYGFVEKIFNFQLKFHKLFLRFTYLFKRRKYKTSFTNYYGWYLNEHSIIRRKANYLYYLKEFLMSIGYNRYYGRVLDRAEDIEKATASVDEFYFHIPTIYCYGTYDTHLYKSMQKDLLSISNTIAKEIIPELNPKFFDENKEFKKNEKGGDTFEFN